LIKTSLISSVFFIWGLKLYLRGRAHKSPPWWWDWILGSCDSMGPHLGIVVVELLQESLQQGDLTL